MKQAVSAIIATVGRPELLRLCLESLAKQTVRVAEVVVVHCGSDSETLEVTNDRRWSEAGFEVRYFHHPERNCARQRNFAISQAKHDYLLLIDDDVEVDPHWVEELLKPIWADSLVGATMGRLTNQPMSTPTFFWRLYRRLLHGKDEGFRPGKLIGAALPNGFPTTAEQPIPCEWIGGDVVARAARAVYEAAGIGPDDIRVVELHDCFAQNEVITYEALGLCPEGGCAQFIADEDNTYGGRCVVNPSGGLLSKGHPLGATGLAQCYELTHQLRGTAEARQ